MMNCFTHSKSKRPATEQHELVGAAAIDRQVLDQASTDRAWLIGLHGIRSQHRAIVPPHSDSGNSTFAATYRVTAIL
jgi:hypothetical protein